MSVDQHADTESGQVTGDTDAALRAARPSLQSLLLEAGVASEDELRQAFEEGQQQGLRLGEVVLERGWLTQDGLAQMLARQWSLPFIPRESLGLDPAAAEILPTEEARDLRACVIGTQEGRPLVALAEPTTERLNALHARLGSSVQLAVVTEASLEGLLGQRARVRSPQAPVDAYDLLADEETPPEAATADAQPSSSPDGDAAALDDQTDALVAELEQATHGLSAARTRIEQLADARRGAERMVADLNARVSQLDQERAREHERSRDVEAELEAERERSRAFRRRLAELLAEFEG